MVPREVLSAYAKSAKLLPDRSMEKGNMVVQQEWFTVEEAAEYLRVSKRTIYRLCKEGHLVGYRTSNRGNRRFRKEERDRVLKRAVPENDAEGLLALNAMADPVLAEIWNNSRDAAYDRI